MLYDKTLFLLTLLPLEILNTLYMVLLSSFPATIIGGAVGLTVTVTSKGHIAENTIIHTLLGYLTNIGRSIPFVILMVALIPLTRLIAGTSLGSTAAIVPLTVAAVPFFSRIVESAVGNIDKGVIEAAETIGSKPYQIVFKVLIPEALPTLVLGITNLVINIIGCSTIAGTLGAGGLGKVAVLYGYQRFDAVTLSVTIALLIILVQSVQSIGNYAFNKIYLNRGRSQS